MVSAVVCVAVLCAGAPRPKIRPKNGFSVIEHYETYTQWADLI